MIPSKLQIEERRLDYIVLVLVEALLYGGNLTDHGAPLSQQT
jgi:hypothetical protein